MATANHVLLRRITLTSTASSVTFDSIPQTGYTDLKLVISSRADAGTSFNDGRMTFNGSATGYSSRMVYGTGSGVGSASNSGTYFYWINEITTPSYTANTFNNTEIYIPNYTSSNQKSISVDSVSENNGTLAVQMLTAGLWTGTAAVSSITFTQDYGNFTAGSSFSLYGIANAATTPLAAPKADGGDIIKTDGTYWYHAFLSSGTFKPQLNLTADVLCVAGGGSGGQSYGGGGGAGGVIYFASQSLASSTQSTVVVGAGGSGVTTALVGNNGSNSYFASLTPAIGGGGGGGYAGAYNGANGGSGGGSSRNGSNAGSSTQTGTGATSYYGNAGGTTTNPDTCSGGGGAGAAGTGGSGTTGGNGGNGTSAFSSWGLATSTGENVSGTVYYAGGGSGNGTGAWGNGGYGGGGKGGGSGARSAMTNTGGGGFDGPANGASGIVIIRYPV